LLAYQNLARGEPRKFGRKPYQRAGHHPKLARRDIHPRQRCIVAHISPGGKKVVPPRVQQAFLGQRAGRDQPHDLPRYHRFGAAPPCLSRVLHLLGNRHTKTLADQREKIALGGMNRHAAHRNILPKVLPALGERDIERGRSCNGIIEKHLIKIAHAVEQQGAGVGGLDFKILRHHRRDRTGAHLPPCFPRTRPF